MVIWENVNFWKKRILLPGIEKIQNSRGRVPRSNKKGSRLRKTENEVLLEGERYGSLKKGAGVVSVACTPPMRAQSKSMRNKAH